LAWLADAASNHPQGCLCAAPRAIQSVNPRHARASDS
jgi:hypothetical protein